MQLNLGLQVDEEMKKQMMLENGKGVKCPDFCTASFNGCLCKKICHCMSSEYTRETFQYLIDNKSNQQNLNDSFSEMNEAEENLSKIMRLENSANDVTAENESLKQFLEYMETNYKNQYETQRLVIEDLKLQIEELLSQFKSSQNNMSIKNAENSDLLSNLGQRKKDFEDIYLKLKNLEAELENEKLLKSDEDQSLGNLKNKNAKLVKTVMDLKDSLTEKDRKNRENMETMKGYLSDKDQENLELKAQSNRQENSMADLSQQAADLREQIAEKESEIEALRIKPPLKNEVPANQLRDLEELVNAVKAELKKKSSENQKLKNAIENQENLLKQTICELENERRAHENTQDQITAKGVLVNRHLNAIQEHEKAEEDKDELINSLNGDLEMALRGKKDVENDLERFRNEMEELNALISRLKNDSMAKKPNNSVLILLQQENEDLKNAMEDLKKELDHLGNEQEETIRTLNDQQNETNNLKNNNAMLNAKIKELSLQRDHLKAQTEKSVLSSTISAQSLQGQLREKEKQIADLNNQITNLRNDLKETNAKLSETTEEGRNAKGEAIILKKQLADSEKAIDVLNKEKLQLNKNLKGQKDTVDQKVHDMLVLQKRFDDKMSEFNINKDALILTNKERDVLKASQSKTFDDLKESQSNLEKYKLSYNKLQKDLETFKLSLAQERNNKSNKIEELTIELDLLRSDSSLKDTVEKIRIQYKDLQSEMDKKNAEISSNQFEIKDLTTHLKESQIKITQLNLSLVKITENFTFVKKEQEDLYSGLAEMLSEVWQVKVMTYNTYALLTDNETDLKSQEKVLASAKREEFLKFSLELLADIKKIEKENNDECHDIKLALKNIAREKSSLLEQKQHLETQVNDLKKRHDAKTDMVGKLSVKLFVLLTEVERQQTISNK